MPSGGGGRRPSEGGGCLPSEGGGRRPSAGGGCLPSDGGGRLPSSDGGGRLPSPGSSGGKRPRTTSSRPVGGAGAVVRSAAKPPGGVVVVSPTTPPGGVGVVSPLPAYGGVGFVGGKGGAPIKASCSHPSGSASECAVGGTGGGRAAPSTCFRALFGITKANPCAALVFLCRGRHRMLLGFGSCSRAGSSSPEPATDPGMTGMAGRAAGSAREWGWGMGRRLAIPAQTPVLKLAGTVQWLASGQQARMHAVLCRNCCRAAASPGMPGLTTLPASRRGGQRLASHRRRGMA